MAKKRLALIGCGGIGQYHLSHFLQFKDIVDLVGWCDLIPERAEDFKKKAGCGEAYTDYKKMLDETKPDMVFSCPFRICSVSSENSITVTGSIWPTIPPTSFLPWISA